MFDGQIKLWPHRRSLLFSNFVPLLTIRLKSEHKQHRDWMQLHCVTWPFELCPCIIYCCIIFVKKTPLIEQAKNSQTAIPVHFIALRFYHLWCRQVDLLKPPWVTLTSRRRLDTRPRVRRNRVTDISIHHHLLISNRSISSNKLSSSTTNHSRRHRSDRNKTFKSGLQEYADVVRIAPAVSVTL